MREREKKVKNFMNPCLIYIPFNFRKNHSIKKEKEGRN